MTYALLTNTLFISLSEFVFLFSSLVSFDFTVTCTFEEKNMPALIVVRDGPVTWDGTAWSLAERLSIIRYPTTSLPPCRAVH